MHEGKWVEMIKKNKILQTNSMRFLGKSLLTADITNIMQNAGYM